MICRPTGSPVSDASPLGTLIAGMPASDPGMVARSFRYIAIGSSTFSPNANAVTGDAGEISTSAAPNASSKSCLISVRTFCADP